MTTHTVKFLNRIWSREGVTSMTCTAIIMLLSGNAIAQRSMEFEHLSFKQGVGSNWVFDIAEDDKGFVWFAGFSGLTRHDGLVNKHYINLPSDTASLSSNHVYRLMTRKDGSIICSTIGGGLSIYDPIHDNFRRIDRNTHPNLPTGYITAGVQHHHNDVLFLAGRPRSILRFDPMENMPSFTEIPVAAETENGYFRENKTRAIFPDARDSLKYWIVGNFRIYSFDAGKNTLHLEMEFDQLVNYNIQFELISCAVMHDEDHLLLNLINHGFHTYNLRTKQLEFLAPDPANAVSVSVTVSPSLTGGYWIGTNNGQLFYTESDFGNLTEIQIEKIDIKQSQIECIYESAHGQLFIGTNGAGVLKHDLSSNRFGIIKPALSDIKVDHKETEPIVQFGFNHGILHPHLPYYYANSYKWPGKVFLFDLESERVGFLHSGEIESIERGNFVRGPGNSVLTHNGSTIFQTDSSGQNLLPFDWTLYGGKAPSLPDPIRHITFAEDGRLLISGRKYLYLITPDAHHPKTLTYQLEKSPEIWREVLFENSRITFLEQEAVHEWDTDQNIWSELHFDQGFAPEIKAMRGFSHTGHGSFITSALHGVIQVNRTSDSLIVSRKFSQPHELVSNNIYTSRMDSCGYIWLSTDLGFQRFDPEGKSRVHFGYRQNLPILYRDNPFFVNDSGRYASHGINHLVHGRIDELLHFSTTGNLMLTTFEADGINVLSHHSYERDGASLQHKQNNLVFGWSHTRSSSSDFYLSEYKLSGFDEIWQLADAEYRAYYTNVPPGDYLFEISIRSVMDGNIIHQLSIPVSIAPPWWDTAVLKVVVGLILLTVTFGLFRLRLNAVRKKQALISSYNQQLVEMEMQFLRAQMNPHFMFNSLNSIKHFILLNKKEEAVEYLSKFAQLIRSILQYSSLSYISLQEELATLKTYIELEQARFSDGFGFKIEVDSGLDLNEIVLQPLIFQPYVENAIWHGLMHKESDRLLKIVLSKSNHQLVCEVIDNGIGRAESKSIRSKTNTRKSMGIPISEKRIKAQDPSASVQITDLKNDDGSAAGTKVTICLPMKFRDL